MITAGIGPDILTFEDAGTVAGIRDERRRRWTRVAIRLLIGTLGYNVLEAAVALISGARADSVALLGFGLDSLLECSAAAVVLGHFLAEARGADEGAVEAAERRVRRFVGLTFFGLAAYVAGQAAWALGQRQAPAPSPVGIVLAAASLVAMPLLALWKVRAARELRSAALRSEAMETLACSYLSLTLLVGLVANAAAGWWWADPVAALLMTPWLVREGVEGVRGGED